MLPADGHLLLAPCVQGHAGQYVYRFKKVDIPEHLQRIGEVIRQLLQEMEAGSGEMLEYRLLVRMLVEHFCMEPEGLVVKPTGELRRDILQSPDAPEATYWEKDRLGHGRDVVNVTGICEPENPVQLITQVQVAPNITERMTCNCCKRLCRRLRPTLR